MKIKSYTKRLQFIHTFHIAAGARDYTDTVYVELESEGLTGYGEAALPPYLKENTDTVLNYLSKLQLPVKYLHEQFFDLLKSMYDSPVKNYPAMAAFDIALHDLQGKLRGITVRSIYNIKTEDMPLCAYTIGMGSAAEIKIKIEEAKQFGFFKLKLGGENDKELVRTFKQYSNAPFCVDVNRGWEKVDEAIEISNWLIEQGCLFIEQPFEKELLKATNALRKKISIPVILDEAVQTVEDVERVKDYCNGINIKLVKCGGIYPAFQMIELARKNNLKIFIGCMSESSCGVAAAAQLAPLADWIDLDSPMLIRNDSFEGVMYLEGKIVLSEKEGTGVKIRVSV